MLFSFFFCEAACFCFVVNFLLSFCVFVIFFYLFFFAGLQTMFQSSQKQRQNTTTDGKIKTDKTKPNQTKRNEHSDGSDSKLTVCW